LLVVFVSVVMFVGVAFLVDLRKAINLEGRVTTSSEINQQPVL